MRDRQRDKELCQRATPGPWTPCLGSGLNVCTGIQRDNEDGTYTFIADVLPEYALTEKGMVTPDDHRDNLKFICEARDMVPFYIEQLEAAERENFALKNALGVARLQSFARGQLLVVKHQDMALETFDGATATNAPQVSSPFLGYEGMIKEQTPTGSPCKHGTRRCRHDGISDVWCNFCYHNDTRRAPSRYENKDNEVIKEQAEAKRRKEGASR